MITDPLGNWDTLVLLGCLPVLGVPVLPQYNLGCFERCHSSRAISIWLWTQFQICHAKLPHCHLNSLLLLTPLYHSSLAWIFCKCVSHVVSVNKFLSVTKVVSVRKIMAMAF
jgi:hypothetical protein